MEPLDLLTKLFDRFESRAGIHFAGIQELQELRLQNGSGTSRFEPLSF